MKPLAVLFNVFLPGLGSLVIGKWVQAFFQWAIWAIGVFFSFSIFGAIFGFPMIAIAWIWALVTAVRYEEPVHVREVVVEREEPRFGRKA